MMQKYENLKRVLGEKTAKSIVRFLVEYLNWYITYEEIQQLNI